MSSWTRAATGCAADGATRCPSSAGVAAAKRTKIFYATDVHGSERTWRKFLNAGEFYDADVLVMGGDVMGKLTIPIIRESDGHYRATIHGRVERLETRPRSRPRRSGSGSSGCTTR